MSLALSEQAFSQRIKWSVLGLMTIMVVGCTISVAIGIDFQAAVLNSINTLLGVCGAIFANLSGAGGGVVFIPVFSHFGFSPQQMLSSSFGIQCFGMTAGAITWFVHYRNKHVNDAVWSPLSEIVFITSVMSVAGIWSAYGGVAEAPASLHEIFGVFSMVLGAALLAQVWLVKPKQTAHAKLAIMDYPALILIGYFGGVVTAWLSVGVGEILVLYLVFRGFCTTMAVAAAVIVSAITVWSAAYEHLIIGDSVVWKVVLFAGPGAVIGGILARTIASRITTRSLKVFLGGWIFLMGLAA